MYCYSSSALVPEGIADLRLVRPPITLCGQRLRHSRRYDGNPDERRGSMFRGIGCSIMLDIHTLIYAGFIALPVAMAILIAWASRSRRLTFSILAWMLIGPALARSG